jgi:amyloid beta precursor protein binding protein 1
MTEVMATQTEVVAAQTPPILKGPSDKEKKYDRQLRLWAANGQAALEQANILLLNTGSGTVGVETLKNLVLPGMKGFPHLPSMGELTADLYKASATLPSWTMPQ